MLVLMTASYIEVSMKIWIHALYATHAGIRSLERSEERRVGKECV